MSDYRKYIETPLVSSNNEPYTPRTIRTTNKSSRSKDVKQRLQCVKSKQTFLTDTQTTSDYTKSSNECGRSVEQLNQTIKSLRRQNMQLKQQIIDLKSNAYFSVNEDKLKLLIGENDKLKRELTITKKQLDDSIIQKNFLQRFNKNLKTQCEQLTKQIVKLTKQSTPRMCEDKSPRNTHRISQFEDYSNNKVERMSVKNCEQIYKSRKSYRSQQPEERISYRPIESSKSKQRQNDKLVKKSRSSSKVFQNQYFVGKALKEQTKKQRRTKKPVEE